MPNQKNNRIQVDNFNSLINLLPVPILILDKSSLKVLEKNAAASDIFKIDSDKDLFITDLLPNININLNIEGEIKLLTTAGMAFQISYFQLNDQLLLLRLQSSELGDKALHAQRLQTLGMLAGAIAHDFNNILAGILGHASYLKGILPKEDRHSESLAAIEDGGKNASQLIQEILNFSRLDVSKQSRAVNLSEIINNTCKLLRGALVPKYNFDYQKIETDLWIDAVEGKIAQIVVNLVMNAKNASKVGATIKLALSSESEIVIQEKNSTSTQQKFACLEISDTGKGIPQILLDKIFEPYFTTSAQGTGLGLKIVDSLVASFGGTLHIISEVDKGTSVKVYLPLIDPNKAQVNSYKEQEVAALEGQERILIVDDEEGVRKVIKLSLEHFGYSVTTAENAKQAIKAYKEASEPYELVILDMLMPEISGKDLFLILREFNPEIKILLVSGYVSEKVVRNLLKQGNCAFLPKPFTVEELTESIRMLFD